MFGGINNAVFFKKLNNFYNNFAVLVEKFFVVNIFERKVIVGIELENADGILQFLNHRLAFLPRILLHQIFCVIIWDIKDLFFHKVIHALLMQFLQPVLQSFVSIYAFFVLKFQFRIVIFTDFIHQFADKKSHQTVKGIFFIRYVVMPQDFFKAIDYFIIRGEVPKVFFA